MSLSSSWPEVEIEVANKNLSKLAPFAGGPWDLPHKFHLYLIVIDNYNCNLYQRLAIDITPAISTVF